MLPVVLAVLAWCPQTQDPSDQLRREELALRLEDLARAGRLEGLGRAVLRELRGRHVAAAGFDLCWNLVALRRWDGKLGEFLAAWDKAGAGEPATPAQLLFRARLESLGGTPASYRGLLEVAALRYPQEPAVLWFAGKARWEAGDYPGAAAAFEALDPGECYGYASDDFHRMLTVAYLKTDRRMAAVEHLRAIGGEGTDPAELAGFAVRCGIPEEAARLYREALEETPEKVSLRVGLIQALMAAGEKDSARAERREAAMEGDRIIPERLGDYFLLLPPGSRTAEICITLQELLLDHEPREAVRIFEPLSNVVLPDDRAGVSRAWESSAKEVGAWLLLGRMRKAWGMRLESVVEAFEKGEKQYPAEPLFAFEKIEPLGQLGRHAEVGAAYSRLLELDPEAKRTGVRPRAVVLEAVRGLTAKKKLDSALRLGVQVLSEAGLDESARSEARNALKPACESPSPEFWEALRKVHLPAPAREAAAGIRIQLGRLSDDEFAVRSDASGRLRSFGLPVVSVLLEHVEDPDVEIRTRVREIIRSVLSE